MALQFNVASVDDLAPEVAALYKPDEKHGGYMLDVTEPDAIRKALVHERDARGNAERVARAAEARAANADKAIEERDAAREAAAALRKSVLEMTIRQAAKAAGLHDAAINDAARAAREAFDVGDDGQLKARDGKTPLDKWFAAAKETSPHWFPASGSGMGSPPGGSARGSGQGNAITRRAFDALPPAQRAALARSGTVTITD